MTKHKDLFSEQAVDYAKFRPRYPQALYEFLWTLIPNQQQAWDVGTGNGQVAQVLATHFQQVMATDISERQLSEAVTAPNITYGLSPAEAVDLPDQSTALITVGQALHWFDFEAFFNEVKRVACSDAVLAAFGYGLLSMEERFQPALQFFYQERIESYWDEARRWIQDEYKSIVFPFEEIDSPAWSMEYDWTLDQLMGYFGTWSAVKTYQQKKQQDPLPELRQALSANWGSEVIQKVVFPMFCRVGRVKK